MAHRSSNTRSAPADFGPKQEPLPTDDESWKISPSTETTSDTGRNLKATRERKREENTPTRSAPRQRGRSRAKSR